MENLKKIHLSSVIFSHSFMNQLRRPPTGISEPFHFKSFSPFTLKRTYQRLFQWPCTPVVIASSAVVVATVKRPNGDLSISRTFGATLYHASHTGSHITSLLREIWLPITFFFRFQTFSMGFMSGEFPCHSKADIHLHSMNVLLLLELWHSARSCIQI